MDTVRVFIHLEHESFHKEVFVDVFLPNRPSVGEIVYLTEHHIAELNKKIELCEDRWLYGEWKNNNGDYNIEDAIYVIQVAHSCELFGKLFIELGYHAHKK